MTDPDTAEATVGLGRAELGENQPQKFGDRKVRTVDMGNPHLVMFGPDLDDVDVAGIGGQLQSVYEGGINVEFIASGEEPDNLVLRVFERGVGETQACGTGSAAAAAAAHSWGLVGRRSTSTTRAAPSRCRWATTRSCWRARCTGWPRWSSTRPPCWPAPARTRQAAGLRDRSCVVGAGRAGRRRTGHCGHRSGTAPCPHGACT